MRWVSRNKLQAAGNKGLTQSGQAVLFRVGQVEIGGQPLPASQGQVRVAALVRPGARRPGRGARLHQRPEPRRPRHPGDLARRRAARSMRDADLPELGAALQIGQRLLQFPEREHAVHDRLDQVVGFLHRRLLIPLGFRLIQVV